MKKMQLFRMLVKLVPYIFRGAPLMFIYLRTTTVIYALVWFMIIPTNQIMFDTVARGAVGKAGYRDIIISVLTVFIILIAQHFLNGLNAYNHMMYYYKLRGYLNYNINEKAKLIDPIEFEDPSRLDDINKAVKGIENASLLVDTTCNILVFYLPQVFFFGIYYYTLKPILLLSILLIFIPVMITQFIRTAVYVRLEDEAAPIRREVEHYENCICGRDYFKETRILGAFGFFKELYGSALMLLNYKQWQADRKTGFLELGMKMITLCGYGGVLYILFDALLKNDITIGAFTAVFISLDSFVGIMKELLYGSVSQLAQNAGTVNNFINFMNMPERNGKDVKLDFNSGIEVINTSFKYPGAEKPALDNVSLKIASGETMAIVGENGAGKTTLVRLITGLYLPAEGTVEIDGMNTKEVAVSSIYKGISAVFQKYQKYKMTLNDNVNISDAESNSEIGTAIQKAGLNVGKDNFPEGAETMLSREFNGIDLSGGQWQRVAIARGFYRVHDLIILDEPTAAIDPIKETRIYEKFAEISKGKTSIIVTHRLGSAKIADRIIVMDEGRIIESGTHEELLNSKGKYSLMYAAQAKWYKR